MRKTRLLEQLLREERERTARLTELLMAREAPPEYAAYLAPMTADREITGRWSDDGLVWIEDEPED